MARVFSIIDDIARADALRAGEQAQINAAQDRARLLQERKVEQARQKVLQGRQDAAFEANREKFGDAAGDPLATSQLTAGANRAAMIKAAAADKERANMLAASTNVVKLLTQARDTGGDVLGTFDRLAPLFLKLGINPDQVQPFRDAIAQDPSILDTLAAGLLDQSKRKLVTGQFNGKPATGIVNSANKFVPIPNFVAQGKGSGGSGDVRAFKQETIGDGTPENPFRTRLTFSDGTTKILSGTPSATGLAAGRLNVSQQNANTSGRKIDPDAAGALKARTEGEKLTVKRLSEALPDARQALVNVENGKQELDLIDEGIRSGSFGEARQGIARFFQDILGLPSSMVDTTDEFFARAGLGVAQQIQAFGSGTGLSDADREFAKKIVGGSQAIDIRAIRRLVNMRIKIDEKTISNFNKDRAKFIGNNKRLGDLIPAVGASSQEAAIQVPDLTDEQTRALSDEQLFNAITGK